MAEPKLLWNLTEAAFYLGLRERIVLDLVDAKAIPHRRIGKAIRFRPHELEAWLDTVEGQRLDERTKHTDDHSDTRTRSLQDLSAPDDTKGGLIPLPRGRSRKGLLRKSFP